MIFSTHLLVQSMGLHHSWPPVIENSFYYDLGTSSRPLNPLSVTLYTNYINYIYRGRLFAVNVPRLQPESGQITPTSPAAPSHSAWTSAPWGLLRCPRERSNSFPLMEAQYGPGAAGGSLYLVQGVDPYMVLGVDPSPGAGVDGSPSAGSGWLTWCWRWVANLVLHGSGWPKWCWG